MDAPGWGHLPAIVVLDGPSVPVEAHELAGVRQNDLATHHTVTLVSVGSHSRLRSVLLHAACQLPDS